MSKFNYKLISYIIGLLLLFNSAAILITSFVSFLLKDGFFYNILYASLLCLVLGSIIMFLSKNPTKVINRRDGYLIVIFGWLTMVFSGTLPYIFTETINNLGVWQNQSPDYEWQLTNYFPMINSLQYFIFCKSIMFT